MMAHYVCRRYAGIPIWTVPLTVAVVQCARKLQCPTAVLCT